jgi:spore maturation protein CgeB
MSLRVLCCGAFGGISTSRMRAEALERLGLRVARLDAAALVPRSLLTRASGRLFGHGPQQRAMAAALTAAVVAHQPDVIWCEKTIFLTAAAMQSIRDQSAALIVHYNPDDPFGTARGIWKTFVAAIPKYDVHLVPKPANVPEYLARGARHVIPFDRGFCPQAHRPPPSAHPRWAEFAVPVAFTGSHEAERSASLAHLARNGFPLAIRGSLWRDSRYWHELRTSYRGPGVDGVEYSLALGAPQITLHFLRHANRDEQDSRTFEIPACGGFMLAEWSPRHAELFTEDVEAVFFRTHGELLEKVRHYLTRPEECAAIAARGRSRALRSGYDYDSRMRELLGKACAAAGRQDLTARLLPPSRQASPTATPDQPAGRETQFS